jgi:hypothetical protein
MTYTCMADAETGKQDTEKGAVGKARSGREAKEKAAEAPRAAGTGVNEW